MTCTIKWLDSGEIAEDIVICISELDQPQLDDDIFYYCHDVAEFMSLTNDDCGEEFQVLQYLHSTLLVIDATANRAPKKRLHGRIPVARFQLKYYNII
jgi:hypothetical protein